MVVFNCKIAPTYFLDEMTMTEVEAVLNQYNISFQNEWEQTRFIGYVVAASQGAKLKTPKDLITFSWEEGYVEEVKSVKPTAEEFERIKADMVNSMTNYHNGGGIKV